MPSRRPSVVTESYYSKHSGSNDGETRVSIDALKLVISAATTAVNGIEPTSLLAARIDLAEAETATLAAKAAHSDATRGLFARNERLEAELRLLRQMVNAAAMPEVTTSSPDYAYPNHPRYSR